MLAISGARPPRFSVADRFKQASGAPAPLLERSKFEQNQPKARYVIGYIAACGVREDL